MSRKIIIQGDDFGYTPEANNGIREAYEKGILSETTVIANLLDINKKIEYRSFLSSLENKSGLIKPAIGVGVHLNLTYGKPITNGFGFDTFKRPYKGEGKPEEWQGSAWSKFFGSWDPEAVKREFLAQIEMALDIFPKIDHLDSHHFVHSYSPISDVVLAFAKTYNLAVRVSAPLSEKPVYGGDFVPDYGFRDKARKIGVKTTDLVILKLFWNENEPLESFMSTLKTIPDGTTSEFMFHPAEGISADDWRKVDLGLLTNKSVIKYFLEEGIEIITYGQLL